MPNDKNLAVCLQVSLTRVEQLREAFFPTLTQERGQHAAEKDAWRDEKIRLEADLAVARSNAVPIPDEQRNLSTAPH